MRKIAVVGLGLIGGSIALALKQNGVYVLGVDSDAQTLAYAKSGNMIDEAVGIDGLNGCEAVFVCVPLHLTRKMVEAVAAVTCGNAIITDVASVKGILKGVNARIVGGHPMAGTEKSGVTAAKSHLFENAFYAIVRYENTREEDIQYVTEIVKAMKAKPVFMTADEHDKRASKVSHLPHMLAYSLVNYSLTEDGFTGSGFMDTTRIAASGEQFWTNVARLNRDNIVSDLSGYIAELTSLKDELDNGDYEAFTARLRSAREKRETLAYNRVYLNEYTLDLDVKDEVGSILRVAEQFAQNGINISGIQIINSREGVGGALRISVSTEQDYNRAIDLLNLEDKR